MGNEYDMGIEKAALFDRASHFFVLRFSSRKALYTNFRSSFRIVLSLFIGRLI